MESVALMERPRCPVPEHGLMELRPMERQTREQRWCGVWYDCANPRCGCSVLLHSPELLAQLAEQRAAASRDKPTPPALRRRRAGDGTP